MPGPCAAKGPRVSVIVHSGFVRGRENCADDRERVDLLLGTEAIGAANSHNHVWYDRWCGTPWISRPEIYRVDTQIRTTEGPVDQQTILNDLQALRIRLARETISHMQGTSHRTEMMRLAPTDVLELAIAVVKRQSYGPVKSPFSSSINFIWNPREVRISSNQ